jgi:hypothetical protein
MAGGRRRRRRGRRRQPTAAHPRQQLSELGGHGGRQDDFVHRFEQRDAVLVKVGQVAYGLPTCKRVTLHDDRVVPAVQARARGKALACSGAHRVYAVEGQARGQL